MVPQRTSVTEEVPPVTWALTGIACSLAMALRIPRRSVLRWGKTMTRPWARVRCGGEARAKVTDPSVQSGTALPTGALAKVRTTSPAAGFRGARSAGAVAGAVVAGADVARAGASAVARAALRPVGAAI